MHWLPFPNLKWGTLETIGQKLSVVAIFSTLILMQLRFCLSLVKIFFRLVLLILGCMLMCIYL